MPEFHAVYGGSNAERWLNCHGSTKLLQQVPKRPTNPAAERGTALHAAAERILMEEGLEPEQFLGVTIKGVTLEADDIADLRIAIDAVDEIVANYSENAIITTETFVTFLDGVNPDDPPRSGGSFDLGIADGKRGAIVDFKFGQQGIVEAASDQNLFYAIAARKSLDAFKMVEEWDCYIVQPAMDPATDKVIYPGTALDRREQEQYTAIKLSEAPNPHFTEGEWCGWCDAKLVCPLKTQRLATLTAPNHILDLNELGQQLAKLRRWDKWREEAEERLHHEMTHGVEVNNWKVVAKRAIRKWRDEAATILRFKQAKVDEDRYMVRELVSPAQAEKQKLLSKQDVAELSNPVSSGTTIAPVDDKRPAVLSTTALANALKAIAR